MPKILPVGPLVAIAASAVAISGCGSAANAASAHSATAKTKAKATSSATTNSAAKMSKAALMTAKVTVNGVKEQIVVTGAGRPVYQLTGNTIAHPKCATKACLHVWPAVTAAHPTARGLHGKVGVWHHAGMSQLTLDGHPLYEFIGDSGPGRATGQGIHSFGGVWYVLSPSGQPLTKTTKSSSSSSSSGY
ncbi:hypothetical protein [Conexibacter sp. DBS9H8]|uniref:COG4315 family predicted lipoprotein n=1 Tax=Conexibacter sp. DBS9H8 TaxID=2937801 RepID=UPI00200BEEC3|nr:hypothetical protein [Conexibacter sp. DBS9H8]